MRSRILVDWRALSIHYRDFELIQSFLVDFIYPSNTAVLRHPHVYVSLMIICQLHPLYCPHLSTRSRISVILVSVVTTPSWPLLTLLRHRLQSSGPLATDILALTQIKRASRRWRFLCLRLIHTRLRSDSGHTNIGRLKAEILALNKVKRADGQPRSLGTDVPALPQIERAS